MACDVLFDGRSITFDYLTKIAESLWMVPEGRLSIQDLK